MRVDRAGFPFIIGALLLSAAFAAIQLWWLAAAALLFLGFFLFFFRDPSRVAPTNRADAVLSPADGRVLVAGPASPDVAPAGTWQQVSIFLSLTDVHVNRIPASGRVTRVSFTRGKYLPAFKKEAASINERSEVWVDHDGQAIVARQIVGLLARRVVCRVESGADVQAGDRFGVMKFGSRMDVFVPLTATLAVSVGDKVRGGETVIAVLHSSH
jgi:phosphatidylserine decarboxylase